MKRKIIAALTALLIAMPMALTSCAEHGVVLKIDGKKIFTTDGGIAVWQTSVSGDADVILANHSDGQVVITLYTPAAADGSGKVMLAASAGGYDSETLSSDGETDAVGGVRLDTDDGTDTYIISPGALQTACAEEGRIRLLCDVGIEDDLNITAPLTLDTDGSSLTVGGDIVLSTDSEGSFALSGNVSAEAFYAEAPLCDITLPDSLLPDDVGFNIAAKSVNSTEYGTAKRVSSMDELLRLADNSCYPVLTEGESLIFEDFRVTATVTLTAPVSIDAFGTDFAYGVTIETDRAGEIILGDGIKAGDVNINAPGCDVIQNNLAIADAAKLYSAASFCGYTLSDYSLGGTAPVPSLSLSAEDNDFIGSGISWSSDGAFTLTATVTEPTAPQALKNAIVTLSAPEGFTAQFDRAGLQGNGTLNLLSPLGCYVRVFDKAGHKSLYRVVTNIATKLPVVVLNTDSGEAITSKEEYVGGNISIQSDYSDDISESLEATAVQLSGRGNSTWGWSDKKPYKLKFDEKTSVLGLGKSKKWVLLANYADKSLMRNYVALETAKVLDNFDCYATQYPVDVFLNGEYIGVYSMGEAVEEGDGRITVRQNAASTDCGFLLELNGDDDENCEWDNFSTQTLPAVEIDYPPSSVLTQKQSSSIQNYLSMVEGSISKLSGYDDYLDTDSLIDWLLSIELSFNSDSCFRRSVYMKKDAMGKLEMCQVWDFDLAFGNNIADSDYDCWACLSKTGYVKDNWITYLMNDDSFKKKLVDRWNEVGDSLLETELDSIDYAYDIIAPSAANNFQKWNILYMRVGLEPLSTTGYTSYDRQVDRLRSFVQARWDWMNAEITSLS